MIGEALAVACRDPAVLARIGGRIGEAARRTLGELAAMSSEPRRRTRAQIAAAARTPVPAGIRGVHPSWIEAELAGMPRRAREALATATAGDPADVWLVRRVCADLPPLPAVVASQRPPGSIDDAIRLPGPLAIEWLANVGADQLAHALRRAERSDIVAIAHTIGDRLRAAVARIDSAPRANALGPERAAIGRCGRESGDEDLLVRIGARAIAPHVDALVRLQLTVRMPRSLGLSVRDELAAYASVPIEHCPTWSALAAPW